MTDDIVARLRVLNHHAKKLAENESLHDLHRDALTRCENLTWQAADEIERLRKERDHARLCACDLFAHRATRNRHKRELWYAQKMGWDCFKEEQ